MDLLELEEDKGRSLLTSVGVGRESKYIIIPVSKSDKVGNEIDGKGSQSKNSD